MYTAKHKGCPRSPPDWIMSDALRWFYRVSAENIFWWNPGRKHFISSAYYALVGSSRSSRSGTAFPLCFTSTRSPLMLPLYPPDHHRPPPLTPALYHSESKKGKIKDFSGAPSRLAAEPGATCCAFAPVCWCAHVWEDPSSEGSKGAGCYRTTAIGAREQEFSTGVSLLKIHCQSVETQAKKERWWEGADGGNNKHRRLDVRVDHGPRPTAVGGGGRRTASLKWQWIKSIKKRRRHCLGVCGVGANWVRGHSETNQKPI